MAILHSFCCWRSLRKGSYACGFYSVIYYSVITAHTSIVLKEEIKYLKNISQDSYIDHDITSNTTALFAALIVLSSTCGILSALLLLYGIYKNIKILLVPWIFNMAFFIIVDVMYVIFSLIFHALKWNPSVAILITVDFFLNSLNTYALLCVISQYQEFKAGRGRPRDDLTLPIPNIQYSCTQPTGTSGVSTRGRTATQWRPTPSQSPTAAGGTPEPPPSIVRTASTGPRKSVKFPSKQCENCDSQGGTNKNEGVTWSSGTAVGGADTAPLLDAPVVPP